jgi:cation transporter-like permease
MAQQEKVGPTKLQWALIAVAVIAMMVSVAANFFPSLFPVSGEELMAVGVIGVVVSTIFNVWLTFTVATKRNKA